MPVASTLRVGLVLSLLGAAAVTGSGPLRLAAASAGQVPPPARVAPKPLPAFAVQTLAGESVASTALAIDGRWLLLYVDGTAAPSRELLQTVSRPEVSAAAARLVVVVGRAGTAEAAALQARYPALQAARWLADPQGDAFRALGAAGVPLTLRMRGGEEHGRVLGMLPDRTVMLSLLQSWVTQ